MVIRICSHVVLHLRIIESWNNLGWKRPKRSPSSNPPAMDRNLSLDQATQSPIQSDLEHVPGCGGVHNLCGQPISVPHYPYSKELFLWRNLCVFQFLKKYQHGWFANLATCNLLNTLKFCWVHLSNCFMHLLHLVCCRMSFYKTVLVWVTFYWWFINVIEPPFLI